MMWRKKEAKLLATSHWCRGLEMKVYFLCVGDRERRSYPVNIRKSLERFETENVCSQLPCIEINSEMTQAMMSITRLDRSRARNHDR